MTTCRPSRRDFAHVLRALLALGGLIAAAAHAAGTPAGTVITNSAQANYSVAGVPATPSTTSVSLTVDELIAVRVTPPSAPASVASPDTNRGVAFTITNVGNGPESYALTAGYAAGGDAFDPTPGSAGTLFVDVNADGAYTPGTDTPITGAVTLAPDQSLRVLLVANIPTGQIDGAQGNVTLAAASTTPGAAGAAPGTTLPGQGAGGVDVVVGVGPNGATDSGADDQVSGTFQVGGGLVAISKVVLAALDTFGTPCTVTGGNQSPCFVPGATVEYRITATVTSAAGTVAQNLAINDNVPANTTWVTGSIRVNGAVRTDAADGDNASCVGCGNASGTLTVNLGNVAGTAGGVVTTIDYRVRIN
jgi:uncharacterized repeat protein (TIGR01451 family)